MSSSILRRPDEISRPVPAKAFAKGRRVWDEWIGGAMRREKLAYGALFAALALAGFAEWDAYTQHQKGQFIPYVVERDALGTRVSGGVLDGPRAMTDGQIRKRLLAWVRDTRMIVADYAGLRAYVHDAYDMTHGEAAQKLIAYHQADPPEDRAAHYTVYPFRETALRVANRTWQVEWCEHKVSRDGASASDDLWRMTATYEIDPPTAPADIDRNPEGFFVIDFDWRAVPGQSAVCASAAAGDRP